MFIQWYYCGHSLRTIRDLYAGVYENRQIPAVRTISSIIEHFKTTGSVNKLCKCQTRVPPQENEADMNILLQVVENRNVSIRQIENTLGIPRSTVYRKLKRQTPRFKSFKYKLQQQLLDEDRFPRMQFCETMLELINNDRTYSKRILFSDECSFPTHGIPNRQNFRYWSTENLHLAVPRRSQFRKSVNVWAGLLGHRVIGPFFIDGTLTAEKYLQLLQENVGPGLEELALDCQIIFQQDGCPAHSSNAVREYLNNTFPDSWIGRGGTIHWPARSPDMAPNDYFLWGFLNDRLYNNEQNYYNTVEDLKAAISVHCQAVTQFMLSNVRTDFYDRLGYCMAANGGLFEHLIN